MRRRFTILQRTTHLSESLSVRNRVVVSRHGVEALYERQAVGGGFYTDTSVLVPWPWKKVS